jgi:aspartate-semialdehyde dehydrogenase
MMQTPIPDAVKNLQVYTAEENIKNIADSVDFVFCAVDMKKDEIKSLEEAYAKLECPVVSNNSAHRWTADVPMIIPEINPEHLLIIEGQRKRLGTKRGFIAVKSNCSIQSYVPAIHPLKDKYGLKDMLVCTYQGISGAGKTFETWPEMVNNVIPYIGGDEEGKSEREPLKIWGSINNNEIVPNSNISITAQCLRVATLDGHMAAVFMSFDKTPEKDEILEIWQNYKGLPQELDLPSAPKQFLHYFEEDDRPQSKIDCTLENGMAISLGRLRPDSQYDYKFIGLSHNTLRGAAGGAVLTAELLCAEGYID